MRASNESVDVSGESGVLRIDISGSPDVINLDTILLTFDVEDDVIALLAPDNTCTGSDWICNYAVSWSALGGGQYDLKLVRKSSARSLILSNSPILNIPFKTYLSDKRISDVKLGALRVSRSTASSIDGSVTIGEACGDSVIVDALKLEVAGIKRLVVAEGRLNFGFASAHAQRLQIRLHDLTGITRFETAKEVSPGVNQIEMLCPDLISGAYRLVVVDETATYSRSVNVVR
jgi:hypothetical protein